MAVGLGRNIGGRARASHRIERNRAALIGSARWGARAFQADFWPLGAPTRRQADAPGRPYLANQIVSRAAKAARARAHTHTHTYTSGPRREHERAERVSSS